MPGGFARAVRDSRQVVGVASVEPRLLFGRQAERWLQIDEDMVRRGRDGRCRRRIRANRQSDRIRLVAALDGERGVIHRGVHDGHEDTRVAWGLVPVVVLSEDTVWSRWDDGPLRLAAPVGHGRC